MADKYSVRHFLGAIYGYTFFNAFVLLAPVYAVFMQANGISDMGISLLVMLWSAGVLLTQFPVTWITSHIGAKNILFIGQMLKIVAFISWMLWPCFAGFAFGMFLWGIQGAIYNVVSEDILFDELRARTHNLTYERVLGRRRTIAAIGTALSAAGSLMLVYGYPIIMAFSVVSMIISMLFLTRLHLIQKYRGVHTTDGTLLSFKTAISVMRHTPVIIALMILCVLVTNFAYLNDYLALIGYDIGLPAQYIGVVPFFMLCCQIIGQTIAYRFTRLPQIVLFSMIIVVGALFGLFAMTYTLHGLIALGVAYTICAIIKILLYARFQKATPSEHRMEILSFYSIADQTTYMLVCLVIGLGTLMGSWRFSIMILGILLGVLGLYAIVFVRRHTNHTDKLTPIPQMTVRATDPTGI